MGPRFFGSRADHERAARKSWYLHSRDRFVAEIMSTRVARSAAPTPRVLDVGCGTGGLLSVLSGEAGTHVGVDVRHDFLVLARDERPAASFVCARCEQLPFPADSFDVVVSTEVLEHLDDDERGLAEMLRISRRWLVFTVPAHAYLWTDSDDILQHRRRYSRNAFEALLARSGAHVVGFGTFGLVPGLLILAYRWLRGLAGDRVCGSGARASLPLARRYELPPALDRLLARVLRIDFHLGRKGWLPWGHALWAVCQKVPKEP